MEADFYFRMGSTHHICQDYALAGRTAGGSYYAILSDGCSGTPLRVQVPDVDEKDRPVEPGSPYTDIGARFLAWAARKRIDGLAQGVLPSEALIHEAASIARQAELPRCCLDATLLVAVSTGSGVRTYQTGDGVIAHRARDGRIEYTSRQYGNNSPYYLSYLLDKNRENALFYPDPETSSKAEVEAAGTLEETVGSFNPQTKEWTTSTKKRRLVSKDTSIEVDAHLVDQSFVSSSAVDLTILFSDGILSFQQKNGTPVPVEEVLEQLFSIKGFVGEFLTRRCNRFLQSFCADRGWQHSDDFSAAALYHGPPA